MSSVMEIVEKQKNFASIGTAKDINFRKKQLLLLKKTLQENETYLCEEIFSDLKKSPFENYLTELRVIYLEIDYALKNLEKWSKPKKIKSNISNFLSQNMILPCPLGTTLIIGAWNYPYQLTLVPAISAIAAGNTAILKPSELPSRCSAALKKIINENFDSSFLHVIEGGIETTTELLSYSYGKICFTGSTSVGVIIAKAAAETLTPTLLELGGKSPCIVMPDVDIKLSAKRIVWGKFLNAGQTCIAPDYLLIHSQIYDEFLLELKNQIALTFGPNPLESENYIKIINPKNVQRLKKLFKADQVYSGGGIIESENYIEPTILKNTSWNDECMKEEIFGPILPAIAFNDIDEIIPKIKDGPNPLALYLFTRDKNLQSKIIREIQFGGGCINDVVMHFSNHHLPFGGIGQSGMGNYHGKYGFDAFTHFKPILKKSFWFESSVKYAPYTKLKMMILKYIP